MDRKSGLILGVAALVVLVIGLVVVFGGGGAKGPEAAAQDFFAAIPGGGAQAAYGKASPAFRNATPADAWSATAAQHDLSQYSRSSWTRSGEGGAVATLNGVLTLKTGAVQPATVRMVKGDGGWSVFSLDLPSGGVTGAAATAAAAGPGVVAQAGGVQAAAPDQDEGQGAPVAPSGAVGGQSYAGGPAAGPGPNGPGAAGYPPPGPPQQGQPQVATLVAGRIAHDCGPQILRLSGVYTVDIHCTDGVNAVAGAGGRCEAMVDGRPATVDFTVRSYDPARDDAEFACRLE